MKESRTWLSTAFRAVLTWISEATPFGWLAGAPHGTEVSALPNPQRRLKMSIYTPSCGESADGVCGCGAPATTEIQVGWHNPPHGNGPSGGQYQEMCEECFAAEMSRQQVE